MTVTDRLVLNTCTDDVAATGDCTFVESAQTLQSTLEQLPPEERITIAAVPSQGLFSAEASVMDEAVSNPAGLLTNPAVLGVLGVLLLIILLWRLRQSR